MNKLTRNKGSFFTMQVCDFYFSENEFLTENFVIFRDFCHI